MTLTTTPPVVRAPAPDGGPPAAAGLRGLVRWLRIRRPRLGGDAIVLVPLLVLTTALMRVGLFTSPQRIDDEGTYTAQAWAVFHLGQLTHYTYWYDHPPLGWLQIALLTQLSEGFDRAPNAVGAGREVMLVLTLVSTALLWVLARRLQLPRWAAALAVGLFAFSPLAVQFHRTVYLDNVATPWVLAAFVLVLSPSRRLGAFAGAAVCLAVAVLTKETSLLGAPVLGWLLWHRSKGETRRYALAVAASLFALVGVLFVLFAALKGEVLPGVDHTSLLGGAFYQLTGRASSGSIFSASTLGHKTVGLWLQLDVVLPALAVAATPLALLVRRLRPFAVAMLILVVMLVRPGYLPVPFVIAMIPLGALLVAGVAASAWQNRPHRLARPLAALGVAATLAVTGATAPGWVRQLRGLTVADLDAPMTQATTWIEQNVPRDDRIMTDDALWVDLVEQGRARENVVWFYKPDTDPAVPRGWQNYRWIVSTDSVRSDPGAFPTLADTLRHSRPEAVFGSGVRRVEVRRVLASNPSAEQLSAQRAAAATAGQQLVDNPALQLDQPARDALLSGRVDPRLLTVLALAASQHRLRLGDLPAGPGQQAAGADRRSVAISAVDGEPVTATSQRVRSLTGDLSAQPAGFRPTSSISRDASGTGVLTLSFRIATS